ncbi:MAG: hypothetical protein QOF81_1495 [Acidimicrobiaceae bacterium]|nr:hypothetical protein [Acidimicrobiaceae bacterium]MDQ1415882.1 hypothetical protein [Acidimicrobiaceae bacterium]
MSRIRTHPEEPEEDGFTLVEVMVSSAILLVVIAILGPILTGSLTTFGRQSDRAAALDQAGLAVQQLEHDVLASAVLNVVAPGNDLQLITGQVGQTSCVEYRVPSQAAPQPLTLQRRARTAGGAATWPAGGGWQTLLTGLKLSGQPPGSVVPNPAGANPFTSAGNLRSVNIDLQIQNGTSPVNELKTTATGRTVIAGLSGTAAWTAQCS